MRPHRGSWRVILACLFVAATALPAAAQDVPFAFLIKDGWQVAFGSAVTRSDMLLTSSAGNAAFHSIVNGQKGPAAGTAYLSLWSKSVPDPFFAPIGSLSGVITLDFGALRGHLTVFETPAGLQTTLGIEDSNGTVNYGVSGVWALGNGAAVAGGTANDMVVGGVVRFRSAPQPIGSLSVPATLYFPTVPFPSDPVPFLAPSVSSQTSVGAFYGFTPYGAARTYRRRDVQFNGFTYDVSFLLMNIGGDSYVAMVCTELGSQGYLQQCTVSGTGALLAPLTGSMPLFSTALSSITMQLKLFLAP